MSAGTYDITIEQGVTFSLPISYADTSGALDLSSGYTVRMKIKEAFGGSLIASTESEDDPNDTLTTSLASSGNNIVIGMSAPNTASLDFDNAFYDIELVSGVGSVVTRVLEGTVKLSREITA